MSPYTHDGDQESAQTAIDLPYLHLLACPRCQGDLRTRNQTVCCSSCATSFPVKSGIPCLFSPNDPDRFPRDVTERVQAFYEEHPFPDYEGTETLADLMEKARESVFADLLDRQIPFGVRILDCGCGTGQLSNFLGIAHRTVFGTDICLNSLQLAERFRRTSGLQRVFFCR